ncbi:MAG: hypothetical protein ACI8UZ_001264 [Akkermansiaceae bacterium]|jgi:hypothetical protein
MENLISSNIHLFGSSSSFLLGLSTNKVDYDRRDWNTNLECPTACALAEVRRLCEIP